MGHEDIHPALIARFEWSARICALAVAALGIAVLFGWAFDITALKSVLPQWVTMKANAALGFLLAGMALLAASWKQEARGWSNVQLVLATTVIILALLTVGEYLFAADFGIDQVLFVARPELMSTAPPGRMALAATAGLAITGLALVLLDSHRARFAAQSIALVGLLIGILGILGYVYNVATLYRTGAYTGVALHTAIGLVAINLGVLLARPRRGLMAVLISRTAGGVMARRLLPLAFAAPFLIGWLRIKGEEGGFYSSALGVALVALTYIALLTFLIWRTAEVLRASELRRLVAERKERKQQAQLSGIIDSAMDAIITVDADQRIVVFNPAAEQMFGRKAADVIGGPHDVLVPQRFQAAHVEHIRAFGATGASKRRMGEMSLVIGQRANGEEFPIGASISRLQTNGDSYYTVILRDITESRRVQEALRESEARFRLLASATFEGIAVTDQGRLTDANEQLLDMLGYRREELIGLPISALLPAEDRERVMDNVRRGRESRIEHTLLRKDGLPVQVEAHGQNIASEGRTIRITAVRDITARWEAERALQAAKAEAERANDAKSRFLAAASHDLRQPLSALALYVTLLADKLAPADRPLLENMKDCIGSLSELLTDLLDLSKLDAGVVTPNLSDFPIADALTSLESVHAPAARMKGLRLHCVSSELMARTDPVLLRRILGNLVDNAIRYTERGGVLVACRRRLGKTWVEVWDTGVGVPADKTAEIFEEFKQLGDEARTRGSGLGLAIVAKSAALLGLEISLRSRPGRGSVFAVELPLGEQQAILTAEPSGGVYRSLRIALVDDNAMVRQALSHALQNAGHQVVAAATGEELRAELAGLPPDIVVCDYRLAQGETGFDVITAMRSAMGADLPALIVTGDTDQKLMRSMAERGIVVVHKPLDLATLQTCLEDVTRRDVAALSAQGSSL